jgi:hypothetical protein
VYFVRYLQTQRVLMAFAGSLWAGAGYLVRPEAVQIAMLAWVVTLAAWMVGRGSRRQSLMALLVMTVPLVLCVAPYAYVKGSTLTKKAFLIDLAREIDRRDKSASPPRLPTATEPTPANAIVAPTKTDSRTSDFDRLPRNVVRPEFGWTRYAWGMYRFLSLWGSILGFVFAVPIAAALVTGGVTWSRWDLAMIGLAAGINMLGLPVVLYCFCGYLDVRHLLPTAVMTSPWIWPGCVTIAHGVRWALAEGYRRLSGRMLIWPFSAEVGAGSGTAMVVAVLAAVSMSLGMNRQMDGLRSMGAWLAASTGPDDRLLDPCFISAFYGGREEQNVWPYVGNLTVLTLAEVLDAHPRCRLLVVSDLHVKDSIGIERLPTIVGGWHLEEIHALPIDAEEASRERVRAYRVARTCLSRGSSRDHR